MKGFGIFYVRRVCFEFLVEVFAFRMLVILSRFFV